MVEYHGWATIRVDTTGENSAALGDRVAALEAYINKLGVLDPSFGIRYFNGIPMIWANGACNHWSQTVTEVLDLFEFIARSAPGSYGILYIWNDEDAPNANAFVAWRLSRGKMEQLVDAYLSPCVPMIEDK